MRSACCMPVSTHAPVKSATFPALFSAYAFCAVSTHAPVKSATPPNLTHCTARQKPLNSANLCFSVAQTRLRPQIPTVLKKIPNKFNAVQIREPPRKIPVATRSHSPKQSNQNGDPISNNQRRIKIHRFFRADVFNPPLPVIPKEVEPQTIHIGIDHTDKPAF